ncbi:hypothetical protein [Chitinophaga silvatica]|nr:hypothetical protein [Chitinophaga silvatica]
MKRIILLLLLATGFINAYTQTDNPNTTSSTKENTTGRKIKKLLILTAGPMSSRKIAQDLKYALDKEFKNKEFMSSLSYLGDIDYLTEENIQIASKMYPHDAILLISPELVADSTRDYVHRTLAHNLLIRDYSRPVKKKRTKEFSTQASFFSLLDDANPTVPFWSTYLVISTNLASNKYFDDLVKTLIYSWNAEKISIGS